MISLSLKEILGALSIILGAINYFIYIRSILVGQTRPHMFSWIVWGTTISIAAAAQFSEHGGPGAWATGFAAACHFIVVGLSIKHGETNITRSDWISLLAALAAIPLWYFTDNPLGSVILVSLIDLVGCYPTLRKSYVNPWQEPAITYIISELRSLASLFALAQFSLVTVLYPATLVFANIVISGTILLRRRTLRQADA